MARDSSGWLGMARDGSGWFEMACDCSGWLEMARAGSRWDWGSLGSSRTTAKPLPLRGGTPS
eukprot:1527493-Prymnesium_polylepis.1